MDKAISYLAAFFLIICISLDSCPSLRAQIHKADIKDPLYLALFPQLNPATGLSPVAEPAPAVGKVSPRPQESSDCEAGFEMVEPVKKELSLNGVDSVLLSFFVTTRSKPGIPAPCYYPEHWVCVFEKEPTGAFQPVDCSKVDQKIVFPENHAFDTSPFQLDESEQAFGIRVKGEYGTHWVSKESEALILFRLANKRLSQILAVPMDYSEEDYSLKNGVCRQRSILKVERTKTNGFFDWKILTSQKGHRLVCKEFNSPAGLYRWNGGHYFNIAHTKKIKG